MIGETQIIVAAEVQQCFAITDQNRTLRSIEHTAKAIQVLRLTFNQRRRKSIIQ